MGRSTGIRQIGRMEFSDRRRLLENQITNNIQVPGRCSSVRPPLVEDRETPRLADGTRSRETIDFGYRIAYVHGALSRFARDRQCDQRVGFVEAVGVAASTTERACAMSSVRARQRRRLDDDSARRRKKIRN